MRAIIAQFAEIPSKALRTPISLTPCELAQKHASILSFRRSNKPYLCGHGELMKFRSFVFVIALILPAFSQAETLNNNTFGKIPLSFEANNGQVDGRIRFLARGPGYGVFFTSDGAVMRLLGTDATVHMRWVGGNRKPRLEGLQPTATRTNYLTGPDAALWHADVPNFSKVQYNDIYPGIDLTYYGNQRQLEYDLTVAPGVNSDRIRLQFDGVRKVELNTDGSLSLKTAHGEITQPMPVIYQEVNGRRIHVDGGYVVLNRRTVTFRLGAYDKTKPLVIDPTLVFSTYFGGTNTGTTGDQGNAITLDAAGNIYVTGHTTSADFPLLNPFQNTQRGQMDGFVFKLNPAGTDVLYSTFFGGTANDEGHSIAVDSGGNAFIVGFTSSDNFPTTADAIQRTKGPLQEGYLLKLSPAGNSILYSTYLGGNGDDRALSVAVDPKGGIYVTGFTGSTNFPVVNGVQTTNSGGTADVFVMKLGPTLSVVYSTYFGGRGNDQPYGITVDAAGAAYVVGYTTSTNVDSNGNQESRPNFPLTSPLQTVYGGGTDDAFIFKLNPAGATEFSTYWGGRGTDEATRVAVSPAGTVCFTGYTNSDTFPLVAPIQFVPIGGNDAFISCLGGDGKSAVFSTLYGGEANDGGVGVGFDADGNVFVAGYSDSILLRVVNAIQPLNFGQREGFIMKLDPAGQNVLYATYLGGDGVDAIVGLAVDAAGNAYITGITSSSTYPLAPNAIQPQNNGGQEVFVTKLNASDVVASSDFQISGQGGATVFTTANSTDPVFGYATADVPNGGSPTGVEILSFRQNEVTVSEVAIPAPALVQAGRLFVEVDSVTRSVVSIANPNDEDATVDFFFTNTSGESSGFVTQTVAAHTHFSAFVSDPPFSLPVATTGTINFTSSIPVAPAAFRTLTNERSDFILSNTPIADLTQETVQPVTIPHFADGDGWQTSIILVNTSEDTMHGEIRFFTPGSPTEPGQPLSIRLGDSDLAPVTEYEIPPRSFARFNTFGTATITNEETGETTNLPMQYGTIQVVPAGGTKTPQAHAVLTWTVANIKVMQTPITAQLPRKDLRLYVESAGDFDNVEIGSKRTAFAVANPTDQPVRVKLDLTGIDGTPTGRTATVMVPAKGEIANYVNNVPGFENLPVPFQGILRITALDGPGVTSVGLRAKFNERFQYLATTTGPIVEDAGTPNQLIFPHIAAGAGYSTEYVMVARITGQGAAGTLRFVTQAGTPLSVTKQ